jgi:ATP-dependent DNA helicase RecG
LTPEKLLGRHSSHPRNKGIAYTFFKAGFIESWGRGYKKIRDGFEGAGLPMPKIEDVEGGVRVTFQRNNTINSQIGNQTTTRKGIQKSIQKGIQKGIQQEKIDTIHRLQAMGLSVEQIAQGADMNVKEVKKLLQ